MEIDYKKRVTMDSSAFVLLSDYVPAILQEIRYYSTYNFIGDRIDGYEDPCAILTADADGGWRYEARELKDEYLPEGFQDFSRDWFTGIARDKVRASLSDGTEEELDEMADFAARFHAAAFSGSLRKGDETWSRDPAFQLWGKRPEASFGQYLRLLMAEASEDPLHAERE